MKKKGLLRFMFEKNLLYLLLTVTMITLMVALNVIPASADVVNVGVFPRGVAVNSVTNKIYVANTYDDSITEIDGVTKATSTIQVGHWPQGVAVNSVTNKIYVANSSDGRIMEIDGVTKAISTIALGDSPGEVAVNSVTNKIYVANFGVVMEIDGVTNATNTTTIGNYYLYGLAVNSVTNKIYVTNSNDNNVTEIDGDTKATNTIALGNSPYGVAVNSVTNKIYVTNIYADSVTEIDGVTEATNTIAVGITPVGVAVNPVTNKIYVVNGNDRNITEIDGVTQSTAIIAAGFGPFAVAVNSVTNNIYVTNSYDNSVTDINYSVISVVVKTTPTTVSYTAGDNLDLAGLVVTLTNSDSITRDVAFADFAANGITTAKSNGTALVVGDTTVAILVNGHTVNQAITVNPVPPATLVIGTTNPPDGTVGTAYSGYNFISTGGTGTKTYAVTVGTLPAGLVLATDGTLSGTPTASGSSTFTIMATDSATPAVTSSNGFIMNIAIAPVATQTYTITYIAGTNGTTTGSAIQVVNSGANGTPVTAVANVGYHFVNWSDNSTNATRTEINVSKNISVTASFIADVVTPPTQATYTLTYIAGANGTTTGSAIQVVNSGSSGTPVTAVPNTGYYFVSWSDGKTTATRTDSNVTSNSSITASFAITSRSSGGNSSSSNNVSASTAITIQGNVEDDSILAEVTIETDGTKTVRMKSSDAIVIHQPDGKTSSLTDFSKLGFLTPVTLTGTGSISATIATDGTIQVKGLADNTEYRFSVTYDLGNAEKITIGSMDVKVDINGVVKLISSLIDPYGKITDEATGESISGVNVTLYYANTDRNKAAGKTPDTAVTLPGIDGFNPNNNGNPQISDASGAYGFIVFKASDYYVVGTKDGYNKYTGPIISVEQEIVKWNFAMHANGTERLAGDSRVDTSLAIAKATYSNTLLNVILATGENYTDALSGGVLAFKLNAPILLVGTSTEDQEKVLTYLKSNMDSEGKVYILGGYGAVSTDMEAKITAHGLKNIIRLGGGDRYETAVNIADTIGVKEGTPIVLVAGENYADALSISSTAAVNEYPIFIVSKDGLSDSLKQEISRIKPSKIFIIGSQGAVSKAVEDQVSQIGTADKGNIVRIGGTDRFETSLAVAKYFNLTGTITCIATGNDFPDALAGSVYAARNKAHIILVDKALTESETTFLQSQKITGTTIFGGESVVSKVIEQQLNKILEK